MLVTCAVPITTCAMSSLGSVNATALVLAGSVMNVPWDNGGSLGADHVNVMVMQRDVTL